MSQKDEEMLAVPLIATGDKQNNKSEQQPPSAVAAAQLDDSDDDGSKTNNNKKFTLEGDKDKKKTATSSATNNKDDNGSDLQTEDDDDSSDDDDDWDGMDDEELSADPLSSLSDDMLIKMSVLSQVVERYRFLIPSERVDDRVTEAALHWMLELDQPPAKRTSQLNAQLMEEQRERNRKLHEAQSEKLRQAAKGNNNNNNNNKNTDPSTATAAGTTATTPSKLSLKSLGQRVISSNQGSPVGTPIGTPRQSAFMAGTNNNKTAATGSTAPSIGGVVTAMRMAKALAKERRRPLNQESDTDEDVPPPVTAQNSLMTVASSSGGSGSQSKPGMSAQASKILSELDDENGDHDADGNSKSKAKPETTTTTPAAATSSPPTGRASIAGVVIAMRMVKALRKGREEDKRLQEEEEQRRLAQEAKWKEQARRAREEAEAMKAERAARRAAAGLNDDDDDDDNGKNGDRGGKQVTFAGAVTAMRLVNNYKKRRRLRSNHALNTGDDADATAAGAEAGAGGRRGSSSVGRRNWGHVRQSLLSNSSSGGGSKAGSSSGGVLSNNSFSNLTPAEARRRLLEQEEERKKQELLASGRGLQNTSSDNLTAVIGDAGKKVGKTVLLVGGFAFDTLLALKDGVRDTVKNAASNVVGIATDLGIVEKKEDTTEMAELARELWQRCRGVRTTFRKLLEFDSAHYPYTTQKQRRILRQHEGDEMVSREELAFDLQVEESHPVLNCLFGETLTEIPRLVYSRLVSCLHEHPHKHFFHFTAAKKHCDAKRNMSLMFSTVLMFLITLIIVPQLDISTQYRVQATAFDANTGEFPNGCPAGVTKDSCMTIRRTLEDVSTITDMITYFREFVSISEMWPDEDGVADADVNNDGMPSGSGSGGGASAAATSSAAPTASNAAPFLGQVRVGGLIMKVSPAVITSRSLRDNPDALCPVRSCQSLNLSRGFWEYTVSQEFTCAAFDRENSTIVIPFNTTASGARAMAQRWDPYLCEDEDVVATLQYALYEPSGQILSWTTISFVVTKGGAVVPRSYTNTMNLRAKSLIRALAGCHIATFTWLLIVVIFRRSEPLSRFFTVQMLIEYLLTGMNIASLVLIESLPDLSDILEVIVQTTHVPGNVDEWVNSYSSALDVLSWWTLLFYVGSTHVFGDVIGLSVLTKLVRSTAADVTVLLILFSVVASTFLGVARCLFGFTTSEFSYSLSTVQNLLVFLWGSGDFDKITAQNPVAATVYYFAFNSYVTLLVLNILVAVITSRLDEMRERANLHLELYQSMLGDAANFEGDERRWFGLRKAMLPLINVLVDATPFIRSTMRWQEFYQMTSVLCSPMARRALPNVHELVRAACRMVDFCEAVAPRNFTSPDQYWNTALRRAVDTYEAIDDRVSWVFIERCIYSQSQLDLIRDAALIKTLVVFDETNTDVEQVLEFQKQQQDMCSQSRAALARGVAERHRKFADFNSQLSNHHFQSGSFSPFASTDLLGGGDEDGSGDENDGDLFPAAGGDAAATTSGDEPRSPTSPNSIGGNNNNNSNKQKTMKSKSGNYTVLARFQKFLVNQYIIRMIKAHLYFPLKSITSLCLWLGYFLSLLLYTDSSSWLANNLQRALAHYPYNQQCYDDKCKSGFLFEKRFTDISNMPDIGEFIEKLYSPKVFPESVPFTVPERFAGDGSSGASYPVFWDPTIRRVGPVFVRQVRAKREPCQLPSDAAFAKFNDPKRTAALRSMDCYSHSSVSSILFNATDTTPMFRPSDSLLPEDAFVWRDSCVEGSLILGNFDLYPCSGYTATVMNSSQLAEIHQTWLDPAAMLVVISGQFESRYAQDRNLEWAGRVLRVRLDLYIELLPGGAGAMVWDFVDGSDQPMFESFSWCGFLALGVDLLFFFTGCGKYLYLRFYARLDDLASAEQHRPDIPYVSVLSLIATIWLASTTSLHEQLRQSWMLSVLVVSSTTMLCYQFLFPISKMVTHRASYLIRSLTLAAKLALVIVPFYGSMLIAMLYSSHTMFGRHVKSYATLKSALQTVARGMLTDWNVSDIYKTRPLMALFFSIAFFAVCLVVLANLLLTLITAAVDEAKRETKIVNFVQMSAEFSGERVYCDEFVATTIAWHVAERHPIRRLVAHVIERARFFMRVEDPESVKLRKMAEALRNGDRELVSLLKAEDVGGQFFVTHDGRFSRPLESLMFAMPFFRLQELSDALMLHKVPESFIYSVSLFLARAQLDFQKRHPDQSTLDDMMEARMTSDFRQVARSGVFGSPMSSSGGLDL